MSKANAQRLLSEVLALFDGSPALAIQSLTTLLAGGNVLLAPRGHYFENLANALTWAFNGVLRRIGPSGALDAAAILDGHQLPHVLLVENIDSARLAQLKSVLRRITATEHIATEQMMVIATADPASLPGVRAPDREAWDDFFMMRLNGRDSSAAELSSFELESDPLGVDQILPEDITRLRQMVRTIDVPDALAEALEQLPALLEESGWTGVSARCVADLTEAARAVAMLRGKTLINPSHVADMLHCVLSSRLTKEDSPPRALLDTVEEAWDELTRQSNGQSFVPQRKTYVGSTPKGLAPEEEPQPRKPAPKPPVSFDPPSPGDQPLVLHKVYSTPSPQYQRIQEPEPEEDPAEEQEQEEARQEAAQAKTPRATPRTLKALVVAGVLGALALFGTIAFPSWPLSAKGLLIGGLAELELIAAQPESALKDAETAKGLIGRMPFFSDRLESVQYWARKQIEDNERLALEKQANSAFVLEHYEEASTRYDEMSQRYPEHRGKYNRLANEARDRIRPAQRAPTPE